MASNQRPRLPDPVQLLSDLLDAGYTDATGQVIRSIARDSDTGILATRLKQLDERAQQLADKGELMSEDDPVLRALLADFGDVMRKNAILIDAAAPDVQQLGIDGAGQFVRQTTLPGMSDAQLQAIGIQWNQPDPEAVARLVQFVSTDAWANELSQYQTGIGDQVGQIAIRGIVSGQGPLQTARDLRDAIEGIPVYRANSLMRTLDLESFRTAAAANQDVNRDILEVQIRMEALDNRTCLCCIAECGTEMEVGELIEEHDQGRAFPMTKVKGQMGDAIFQRYADGNPGMFQTGEQWFNALSEDEQRAIAGPGAFEALQNNEVRLQDFVQNYESPIFGGMIRQGSLQFARSRAS